MDPSSYIKLIEFTYILEGFQILYEYETDKTNKGEMFSTAEAIFNEIFQYSWFKRTLTSRTQNALSQKWRKIVAGERSLESNLFNTVLSEIHNVCQEYLLKNYLMQRYASSRAASTLSKPDFAQSSLTIDSGIGSMVGEKAKPDVPEKQKNGGWRDKFAGIPAELLEKKCPTATNVLERHINKTFSFEETLGNQLAHSSKNYQESKSSSSSGALKHLNSRPTDDDQILPILTQKLQKFALKKEK